MENPKELTAGDKTYVFAFYTSWLGFKYFEGADPGKKLSFVVLVMTQEKKVGKNMRPTDRHESSVSNGKRGESGLR